LAVGDVNDDDVPEIFTMVRSTSRYDCYLGMYRFDGEIVLMDVSSEVVPCESHAPALADMDGDGEVEIILGDQVYDSSTLSVLWTGGEGKGWFNYDAFGVGSDRAGYWNSGYHSFAYDIDGDGTDMELVTGRTIYNSDGSIYCTFEYEGEPTADGYAAVADVVGGDGVPEIVVTGNHWVYLIDGNAVGGVCEVIAVSVNQPEADFTMDGLPERPDCDTTADSFGGQPTVADFTGDGQREIGVSGSCWYSVFRYDGTTLLERVALTETRDWSSASTGATVFDFNDDGAQEVVFSDEEALYVWWLDDDPLAEPWERMVTLLEDDNHKSWTIHEYPLVADVDGDGKAEIVVVNSQLEEEDDVPSGHFGIYVLGAADDDWVSARRHWNQHAYYVTNIEEDGTIGYASPNYAPYSALNYNSFRTQAPGKFGATAASNLYPVVELCLDEDTDVLTVWVQVANNSAHIGARENLPVTLYGSSGSVHNTLDEQLLPWRIDPGVLSKAVDFTLESATWRDYESLRIVVDQPDGSSEFGGAQECDEEDNLLDVDISEL
jgi:hypothetical protein